MLSALSDDVAHAQPSHGPADLKHWRSFGSGEWRHVANGVLGFVVGSALPLVFFYLALRAWSLSAAVLVMLAWSAAVFLWHRRRTGGRSDVFSAVTFGFAVLEAAVGLVSQNLLLYLATPSLKNLLYGLAFLGSALAKRPLLALYAERLYPIPPPVRTSPQFQRAFLVVSGVWFVGLLGRGLVRLWLLATLPFELYLVVDNSVAGWPFSAALVGFTVWYPLRALRRAGLMARASGGAVHASLEDAVEAAAPGAPISPT